MLPPPRFALNVTSAVPIHLFFSPDAESFFISKFSTLSKAIYLSILSSSRTFSCMISLNNFSDCSSMLPPPKRNPITTTAASIPTMFHFRLRISSFARSNKDVAQVVAPPCDVAAEPVAGVPQDVQNCCPSFISFPHFVQCIIFFLFLPFVVVRQKKEGAIPCRVSGEALELPCEKPRKKMRP